MELYETARLREVEKFFTRGRLSHGELPQTRDMSGLVNNNRSELNPWQSRG